MNKTLDVFSKHSPWYKNQNSIWLASTLKVYRNLEKYNFPSKLDNTRRQQIIRVIQKEILSSTHLNAPTCLLGEDLEPVDKEFLFEYFLSTNSFHHASCGEGFIIDKDARFLATLNIKDHLQLELIDSRNELEESWNQLLCIEKNIESSINLAFSPKFGFLTADPFICGTGFIIYTYLHVPALIHTHKLNEILDTRKEEGIIPASMEGGMEDHLGDLLTLHNNYTLGVSEEKLISSMRATTICFIMAEKSARERIKNGDNNEIKDIISKAFGVLLHSYQLETKEAVRCLSLCKLGVELEWITGVKLQDVNELFFTCRRAHLLKRYSNNIPLEEIPRKRAEYIHENLARAKFTCGS